MAHIRKLGERRYQARWVDPDGRECSKIFSRRTDAEDKIKEVEHSKLDGSTSEVQAWVTERSQTLSPGTVRLVVQTLHSIFKAAVCAAKVKVARASKIDFWQGTR
jgi:hypothetical protein